MHYIVIENQSGDGAVVPVNTDAETRKAREYLRRINADFAVIYAGDPDSVDAIPTGMILEAR